MNTHVLEALLSAPEVKKISNTGFGSATLGETAKAGVPCAVADG